MSASSLEKKLLHIDTSRGGTGPLCPPACWFGTLEEYKQLIRYRWRTNPEARNQLMLACQTWHRYGGPAAIKFYGPFADYARDLIADAANNMAAQAKTLH